jgi:PPM family protein phosphatase
MNSVSIKYDSVAGVDGVNQDRILCEQLTDDSYIAILADGMGGLQYGDLAADIVMHSIYNKVKENLTLTNIHLVLIEAFGQADHTIAERSCQLHCKMGAAVTVVIVKGNTLYCAWQGNVRLYCQQEGELVQLTEDHIKSGDSNTLLTRCVNGKGYRYPIPIITKGLQGVSSLMLCSDGFYQSENYLELAEQNELPPSIEPQQDDASYIILQL